jgi:hypothetical protein
MRLHEWYNTVPSIPTGCGTLASQVADNHRLPLLSAFDAYASGLANLEPSHTGTQYAGTYGCPLDHGISAPGTLIRPRTLLCGFF